MATVLITGTSKGIGLTTALTLARAGHTAYATMRNPSQAPQLAEQAAHENLPVNISAMDVDSDDSVRPGIEAISKAAGAIDVLVNNAGVERNGSIEELPCPNSAPSWKPTTSAHCVASKLSFHKCASRVAA